MSHEPPMRAYRSGGRQFPGSSAHRGWTVESLGFVSVCRATVADPRNSRLRPGLRPRKSAEEHRRSSIYLFDSSPLTRGRRRATVEPPSVPRGNSQTCGPSNVSAVARMPGRQRVERLNAVQAADVADSTLAISGSLLDGVAQAAELGRFAEHHAPSLGLESVTFHCVPYSSRDQKCTDSRYARRVWALGRGCLSIDGNPPGLLAYRRLGALQ
jgi:hypothetical protein